MRHKRNPRNPSHWIGFDSDQRKTDWKKVWESADGCISFFLKNFSKSCELKTLFVRFKEIDRVRNVFILDRRDKEGKRFGFIRFGGNIDIGKVEQEPNNIRFGSYKLRANFAKFSRKSEAAGDLSTPRKTPRKPFTLPFKAT